jgi:hypothetical protein
MDETINRNFSVDPDSFEVPRHSSVERTNRLVYRTNEIKPAANLEEIQKQNDLNHILSRDKENESNIKRQNSNYNRNSQTSKEDRKEKETPKEKEKKPYYGKTLVIVIVILIILEYYAYVLNRLENSKGKINNLFFTKYFHKYISGKYNDENSNMIILVIFHILFFMMIWSLIVTMITHPGEIPLYWVIKII